MSLTLRHAVAALEPRIGSALATGGGAAPGHKELVDELLDELLDRLPPAAVDPDLVLLAYARPDVNGHQTVASYLNMRTGGRAHSFAVSGHGAGTPFTALRIAAAYVATGRCAAPLVAVVERGPNGQEATDAAILLLLGGSGGVVVERVEELADAAAAERRLRAVGRPGERVLAVLGPGAVAVTAPPGPVDAVRLAGGGSTSLWSAVAGSLDAWAARCDVVALCEVDAATGAAHLAVLRPAGRG